MKSYREGGVTYQQFLFLHKSADEYLYAQNRFIAGVHGIDLEGESSANQDTTPNRIKTRTPDAKTPVMFGDPAEYENLSDEEKKSLTQRMLKHWKPLGGKMLEPKKPEYYD